MIKFLTLDGLSHFLDKIKTLFVRTATGTTEDHVVTFGQDGKTIKDSGYTIASNVPANAKFTDTTYSNMTAATASAAGKAGLVPAPGAGKQTSFLRGDGTWVVPTNTTYNVATTSANGLMSSADKTKLNGIATGATKTIVDSALSSTSTNPVQNKIVNEAINARVNGLVKLDDEDLDTIKPSIATFYYAWGNNTCTNNPGGSGQAFGLIAYRSANAYYAQEIITQSGKKLFRQHNASEWSPWKTVLDSSNYTDYCPTKSLATTTTDGLMSSADKTKVNNTKVIYEITGTGTKAGTWLGSHSAITSLFDGLTILYRLNVAGASTTTLNINNLGAKTVYTYASTKLTTHYPVNSVLLIRYNSKLNKGCWELVNGRDTNTTYTNASLGQGYGTCSTAMHTTEKVVTLANYVLATGGIVAVKFNNAVPASATMNINGKGAKAIYYKGAAIEAGTINANDIAYFIYNGTYYILIGIDRDSSALLNIKLCDKQYVNKGIVIGDIHNATITNGEGSFIGGGMSNEIDGLRSSICGGWYNNIKSADSFIGGGYCLIADYMQGVFGRYNVETAGPTNSNSTDGSAFIIGIGTGSSAKSNGFRVSYDGKCYGKASFVSSGAGVAEYYEWEDGNPNYEDRRGHFLTRVGNKVRIATPNDEYIFGVVDPNPFVVGAAHSENWKNMYLKDVFGCLLTEIVDVEETVDEDGNVIPAHSETHFIINPEYDSEREYLSRDKRDEFISVTSKGNVIMIDDGTCQVDSYCTVGEGGIATHSDTNYCCRVVDRIDATHIEIYIDSVFINKR